MYLFDNIWNYMTNWYTETFYGYMRVFRGHTPIQIFKTRDYNPVPVYINDDLMSVVAEYIDVQTYLNVTLTNCNLYNIISRFNMIQPNLLNLRHWMVNHHSFKYVLAIKKLDMQRHASILLLRYSYDNKYLELILKYTHHKIDDYTLGNILQKSIRDKNYETFNILVKYDYMPKINYNTYAHLISTRDINYIKHFCSTPKTFIGAQKIRYLLRNTITFQEFNFIQYIKYVHQYFDQKLANIFDVLYETGRMKFNYNKNINLEIAINQKNIVIICYLLKHKEVVSAISHEQYKKILPLLPKTEIAKLFKNIKCRKLILNSNLYYTAKHYNIKTYNAYYIKSKLGEHLNVNLY
jgi:hypothetical protein